MERRNDLVNIRVENLYPHPDNPRKDLGEITEITESVKKNGVMQNLTVIPIGATHEEPEEQADANNVSLSSDFIVLIGHRRLAAAKAAGIKEVPCKIVSKISKKEQVSIMLEENMQRSDLTIYEQAQGFQMMLDLGETAESIAKKTGFSQATVYHRLNLAKLDPKELKEKEDNEGFQMSLKDLYELEKVSDIDTRNRLLKEARNSSDLAFRAQQAAKEEKRKKTMEQLIVMLEEKEIKPAPKRAENEQWSGKWDKLKQYDLEGKLPEEIKVQARKTDELFYIRWYNQLHIIRATKKNNKISKEEQERKERDKRKKDIKSQTKQLIKKAEGVRGDAFLNRAILDREREDLTHEIIPIDVKGLLNGIVADIPLQKNDVLYIPSIHDLKEEQTLTIHGEVAFPGTYAYSDNMSIEDIIIQAGGLLETASAVKIEIARRVKDPKSTSFSTIIGQTYSFDLKDGFLIGDKANNFSLQPFDEVYVRKSPAYFAQQNVTISGEVMFDGVYSLQQKNERLSDVVSRAGGVTPDAYVKGARLVRQMNEEERRRQADVLRMARSGEEKDSISIEKLDMGTSYAVVQKLRLRSNK